MTTYLSQLPTLLSDYDLARQANKPKVQSRKPSSNNSLSFDDRLLIVSNRLPITCSKDEQTGEWNFSKSSGGLVTAISGVKSDYIWIGWIGKDIESEEERIKVAQRLLNEHNCLPVYISDDLAEKYYNGFANGILWPLFHYMEFNYDSKLFAAYEEANSLFADVILQIYNKNDVVWIHDYHLMLLASAMRKKCSDQIKIGFFLHTPFPSSEIYKQLPCRKQLLEGLLNCDLIGFHTWDYCRHFKKSCTTILGCSGTPTHLVYENRFIPIRVHPVGIPVSKFREEMGTNEIIKTRYFELKNSPQFKNKKVIIGVDRLDYIKGIPHKLRSFDLFLKKNPEWIGRVVLLQIAVPSRMEVEEYKNQKKEVDELVGRINGEYGSLEYQPIQYLYQSVKFEELLSMYALADVCLITSIRDGMNLVAHEYIVTQECKYLLYNTNLCDDEEPSSPTLGPPLSSLESLPPIIDYFIDEKSGVDPPGILILSEFAGASQGLQGSITINPHNVKEVSTSIFKALTMRNDIRKRNHKLSLVFIDQHTAEDWGYRFLIDLKRVAAFRERCRDSSPPNKIDRVARRFATIGRNFDNNINNSNPSDLLFKKKYSKLIFINYEDVVESEIHSPAGARPDPQIISFLRKISNDLSNKVIMMSNRSRDDLDEWMPKDINFSLLAEGGVFFKDSINHNWISLFSKDEIDVSWMPKVTEIFEHFLQRTPGASIDIQETSMSWYWTPVNDDDSFGALQAKHLLLHLDNLFATTPIEVELKHHTIEVKGLGSNPTSVLNNILKRSSKNVKFLLYIGHIPVSESSLKNMDLRRKGNVSKEDITDETPKPLDLPCIEVVSVLVGNMMGEGTLHLKDGCEARDFLRKLADGIDDLESESELSADEEEERGMRLAAGLRKFSL